MSIITIEGVVEQGQIRLKNNVPLPENARVYIVIPGIDIEEVARIHSPRLAHPDEAEHFRMEVTEEPPDAVV